MQKLISWFAQNRAIVLIVLFAAILRLYSLDFVPPSLNWDEVSHGYNAYSILRTGKDEWGEFLPKIFRAYGDYKLPVYIYATVPSIAVFGLTPFGVRFASAVAGIASVFFVYLLTQKLFSNRTISLLAAFLMAVEPWSFFLSRVAVEANLSLFLIIAGVWFFLEGLNKKWLLPIGISLLGLSVWTYNSARIFVPLLFITLFLLYYTSILDWARRSHQQVIIGSIAILFFFLPMFVNLLQPHGQARYGWVAILDEGAIAQINEARVASELPGVLPTLLHNKVTFFVSRFVSNYISYFSPDFLFLRGGTHFQFSVPGHGLIYLVNAPFFLLGLLWLVKNSRSRTSLFILGWFLLSPVPASLTREAPHVLRAAVLLPVPMILTALGLWVGWEWWVEVSSKYKVLSIKYLPVLIYVIGLLYLGERYFTNYIVDYRENYSWAWQYGYRDVVEYAKASYDKYDKVIVTKKYAEPHEFFLFYWPWDPQKYREDPNLIRFFQSNWYWVDKFDKFYFVNNWDVPKEGGDWKLESGGLIELTGRSMLITSPGDVPNGWRHLKTINFLDGQPAFEIYED